MTTQAPSVVATAIPTQSAIANLYESPDLSDAYATLLPEGSDDHPERLARFIFSQQPAWVGGLMRVRDALVGGFGLKTAQQLTATDPAQLAERVGIFKIYSSGATEAVLGEDDRHLNFRLSIHVAAIPGQSQHRLTLSTTVNCHNRFGRAYIAVIAPFHRAIVQAYLRRAAQVGWPQTGPHAPRA